MKHHEAKRGKKCHAADKSVIGRFRKLKFLSVVVGMAMLSQMLYPSICYAVTAGPASPEFSSFEPVATTNMVNEFTGQFIYNLPVLEIPGAAGGGYALSLSYHAGDGPEAEASWVGYGWTLNPGSITRNKRGIPDDYKNKSITYYNSAPKNWTIAATGDFGAEAFSITGTVSSTLRYNYYKGFGVTDGISFSGLKGLFSLGYSNTDGSGSFSAAINPCALLSYLNNNEKTDYDAAMAQLGHSQHTILNSGIGQATMGSVESHASSITSSGISSYAHYLLTSMSSPYNLTPYSGSSWEGNVAVTGDLGPAPIGLTGSIDVSYCSQQNTKVRSVPAYGYMYSGNDMDSSTNNKTSGERIMDYTVENASTFNSRDMYLPVPSSTPDAYFVSGEGLSGGFRMYNDRIGVFSPNYVESHTTTHNFGVDVHLGMDDGVGADFTVNGFHTITVQSSWPGGRAGNGNTDTTWFVPYDYKDTTQIEGENMFFRFNNDLGGQVNYDNNNLPEYALISGGKPNLQNSGSLRIQKDATVPGTCRRSARATYIGYHTNREISTFLGSYRPVAYEQRQDINVLAGRSDTLVNAAIADEVGEISIVNEGGNRYTYGLPVYNADERNLRRGLQGSGTADKYLLYHQMGTLNDGAAVGEELPVPYASQYLLTEITTPDYLDINGNGPDDADFGGYTKFSYTRTFGDNNKVSSNYNSLWYKWRTPFNGLMYVPNRLSDNTDDMGSYQSGYKEIYYLDTIETKTHFAVFTTAPRLDGLDAFYDDDYAADHNVQGGHSPQCLTQIQLYSKPTVPGGPSKLIKTVHFEYNYECWPNNINSSGGNGKLTLKKVWFEYNGVMNAYISPYQFEYQYPTSVTYPSQYAFIQTEMGSVVQNPSYAPYIDCWGNYMDDGFNRRQLMKPWLNQAPSATFDPAAWQLKRIILPSGGEIHVQYEQNTYAYVQNRPACALVSLLDDPSTVANGSAFTLNTADIGMTSPAQKDTLVALLNRTYQNNKIYFKFFYTLMAGSGTAGWGSCNGDYLEGYVNFVGASIDGMGNVKVQISGAPRQLCKDYVHLQVGGKLFNGDCSSPGYQGDIGTGTSSVADDLSSLASSFFGYVKSHLPGSATICKNANPSLSYLRVPVPKKYGGGIRVKRLLMYNKGIDLNSPTLYGTQYTYENEATGYSYGVATNEPSEIKGENPLVTFLPKRGAQSDWDRLIGGKDKEQFEGPLSWYALPSPSVGYSRVIKKSIYQSQATTTGYTVIDYNTAKDYPVDGFYPYIGNISDHTQIQTVKDDWHIDFGILDYDIKTGMRTSQGYCFVQNQMHGQIKSISDYRGVYNPAVFNGIPSPVPVSQKTYTYFQPGEPIPIYDFQNWRITYSNPGKESDITIDRRSVHEYSTETRVTGDITVGYAFIPIFYPIGFPLTSQSEQKMSSVVVNKIIHYPCIMKSMSVMKDGYVQKSDYVAFDAMTGKPVLTTTYDGFNNIDLPMDYGNPHKGIYTAYNVPASANYKGMGQKSWNEKYYYYNNSGIGVSGSGSTYTVAGVNANHAFALGDLVALHYHIPGSTYDGVDIGHVKGIAGSNIIVTPTLKYNSTFSGSTTYKVEILQSGYTNQLSSSMDGVTVYGDYHNVGADELFAYLNAQLYSFEHSSATTLDFPLPVEWRHLLYIASLGFTDSIHMEKVGSLVRVFFLFPPSHGLIEMFTLTLYPDSRMGFYMKPASYCDEYPGWDPIGAMTLVDSAHNDTMTDCKFTTGNIVYRNIIKAQTTTYSNQWRYDTVAFGLDTSLLNYYESGMLGKWRPYETYVYDDTTVKGNNRFAGERNYNYAGTIPFLFGRWDTIYKMLPDKWIRSNHVDAYSPNGHATQEYDAENVYSAAKYGYNGILPYMVAQNSQTPSVHFESFENVYTAGSGATHTEDMMSVDATAIVKFAHTGAYGYQRKPGESIPLPPATDYTGHGLSVRFWAMVTGNPPGIFNVATGSGTLPVKYLGRSGAWALYEATWTPGSHPVTVNFTINNISSSTYVFDDIRVQPMDAKATCYVYDVGTLRLSAVLDDQLFATYYQYNGEGKLVRTLVETTRGIKTVEESQYHVPLTTR